MRVLCNIILAWDECKYGKTTLEQFEIFTWKKLNCLDKNSKFLQFRSDQVEEHVERAENRHCNKGYCRTRRQRKQNKLSM